MTARLRTVQSMKIMGAKTHRWTAVHKTLEITYSTRSIHFSIQQTNHLSSKLRNLKEEVLQPQLCSKNQLRISALNQQSQLQE
jgi:hypothetical protein